MVKLSISSETMKFDIRDIDFSNLYLSYHAEFSSALYRLWYYDGGYDEFRGYGFRLDGDGQPSAGTVTQFRSVHNDAAWVVTGLHIAATKIRDVALTFSTQDDLRLIRHVFAGDDGLSGGRGADRLQGFDGDDRLKGNDGSDLLFGGDGGDRISGDKGADRLYGNAGDDKLVGGAGKDYLQGGVGRDVFIFNSEIGGSNVDKIVDFDRAYDMIQIDNDMFKHVGGAGSLSSKAFHSGIEAHDATDRIIHNPVTGKLYYDADGTGSAEQVQFALLQKGLALTVSDFHIIA